MENLHDIFDRFKKEFPVGYEKHAALGKEVHENSGPLPETTCWLLKIVISAACDHQRALETHINKALAAGVSAAEIKHALLLLIPTSGFPPFMKAYAVLDGIGN